jgi:hypothetical protein
MPCPAPSPDAAEARRDAAEHFRALASQHATQSRGRNARVAAIVATLGNAL